MLRPQDVVVVFSNGGFDNIHEKLLMKLEELSIVTKSRIYGLVFVS